MANLVAGVVWLGGALLSAQVHWQLDVREQLRGGDEYAAGQSPPNTQTVSEIVAPGGQMRAIFGRGHELLVHYQPQLMTTWLSDGDTSGAGGAWGPWTVLHRLNLTYGQKDAHALRTTAAFNLAAGKLDTIQADALVPESGLLPGITGRLVDYTNISAVVGAEYVFARDWHAAQTVTAGIIDYPGASQTADFEYIPGLTPAPNAGSAAQLKLATQSKLSYALGAGQTASFTLDLSDVSYEETATIFGITPSVGYATTFGTMTAFAARAGAMRYWANPYPGIVNLPVWLAVLEVTLDHTFATWGLPKLKGHLAASVVPFYNLQFSDIEPRTSVLGELSYAFSRTVSGTSSVRFFTSEYWDLRHLRPLQRGHSRNIAIVSLSMRYTPWTWLGFDVGGYVSDRTFVTGVQQPYAQLQEFYGMAGLTGTWQVH